MSNPMHQMAWDQMRLRHGLTLRLLEQIPADKLEACPIPGMRSTKEIVVHLYHSVRVFPASVLTGKVEGGSEKDAAAKITDKASLIAYAQESWAIGDRDAKAVTDEQLRGMVSTPWGASYPGAAMFGFVYDEFLHHRGQLYCYLRAFGIEPIMNWDYAHNAPEFQPLQTA